MIEFGKISSSKVETLLPAQTVFFFAVSPLEDYGQHLPLSLGLIEAREMCRLAGERLEHEKPGWTAVLMPDAPLGVDTNTTKIKLTVRPHVLRDWLVDACASLNATGFTHFVCFSGNLSPKQLTAVEDAGKLLAGRQRFRKRLTGRRGPVLVSASSALTTLADMKRSPFWPDPLEHGGHRDTSVALALAPSDIKTNPAALLAQPREGTHSSRRMRRWRKNLTGYWGDPSKASADFGNQTLKGSLDEIFPKLRAVWEGANPNALFRSWYSILPPNQSFFKAWIVSAIILVLILGWIYLSVQTLFN